MFSSYHDFVVFTLPLQAGYVGEDVESILYKLLTVFSCASWYMAIMIKLIENYYLSFFNI